MLESAFARMTVQSCLETDIDLRKTGRVRGLEEADGRQMDQYLGRCRR